MRWIVLVLALVVGCSRYDCEEWATEQRHFPAQYLPLTESGPAIKVHDDEWREVRVCRVWIETRPAFSEWLGW